MWGVWLDVTAAPHPGHFGRRAGPSLSCGRSLDHPHGGRGQLLSADAAGLALKYLDLGTSPMFPLLGPGVSGIPSEPRELSRGTNSRNRLPAKPLQLASRPRLLEESSTALTFPPGEPVWSGHNT